MGARDMLQPRTTPPEQPSSDEILMKQYQLLVDTYKSYLDLVLKFILFSYAVTGGILSYYLSQRRDGIMRFGLAFPIIMNATFAALSFFAARRIRPMSEEVERVTTALKLLATPDIYFLAVVLVLLGCLFVIIAAGLTIFSFA